MTFASLNDDLILGQATLLQSDQTIKLYYLNKLLIVYLKEKEEIQKISSTSLNDDLLLGQGTLLQLTMESPPAVVRSLKGGLGLAPLPNSRQR